MAISPMMMKKMYRLLSIEELEKEYDKLKKNYCFESKEEQINYMISNYLFVSDNTNNNSIKTALEELLKEKTGKEYKIEPKKFDISLNDVINFIMKNNNDSSYKTTLSNYFEKLNEISENDKIHFLIELVQDKNNFDEFLKEIVQTKNIKETYDKFKKISLESFIKNNIKS